MRRFPRIDSPYVLDADGLEAEPDGTVNWERVFARPYPLRIEVGVGNSLFLIEVAKLEPDFNYLGFEYSNKRLAKFLKKVARAEIDIIRASRLNAIPTVRDCVRDGEVDHFFVNFPDPWPKRRHAKKRFVQDAIIEVVSGKLRTGGGISLRTDVAGYARQMVEVLERSPHLRNLTGPGEFADEPRYGFRTPFELKFLEEGKPIYYLEYEKIDAHDTA